MAAARAAYHLAHCSRDQSEAPMMQRRLQLALLLSTMLLLGACVPGAIPKVSDDQTAEVALPLASATSAEATVAAVNLAGPATPTDTRVTITFAALGEDRPLYQPLIEQFERDNPTIHVQFVDLEGLIKP